MANQNTKASDLIKTKYEEISKVLALLEQQFLFECTSAENTEKDLELFCIKGSN